MRPLVKVLLEIIGEILHMRLFLKISVVVCLSSCHGQIFYPSTFQLEALLFSSHLLRKVKCNSSVTTC